MPLSHFSKNLAACVLLLSFGTAFAAEAPLSAPDRNRGGITLGLSIHQKNEFGTEATFLHRLGEHSKGESYRVARLSMGSYMFQAKDSGTDYFLEGSYCIGLVFHACAGLGYRQQNPSAKYLQSTIEVGSAFLISAFIRPLFLISSEETDNAKLRRSKSDLEMGVNFRWPISVY